MFKQSLPNCNSLFRSLIELGLTLFSAADKRYDACSDAANGQQYASEEEKYGRQSELAVPYTVSCYLSGLELPLLKAFVTVLDIVLLTGLRSKSALEADLSGRVYGTPVAVILLFKVFIPLIAQFVDPVYHLFVGS